MKWNQCFNLQPKQTTPPLSASRGACKPKSFRFIYVVGN